MKTAFGVLCLVGIFGLSSLQEKPSANGAAHLPIGLEIGQPAPAFALPDEFGQEQTNQTLKGTSGTVLLFFRSADW